MLVYRATKRDFIAHVEDDSISDRITRAFEARLHRASPSEQRAWRNSMEFMYKVLQTKDIVDKCGVAIEFGVPYTSSRIDFVLTGERGKKGAAIIVELKQWDRLEKIDNRDGLVRTYVGQANRVVPHPSYQAWSYSRMIEDYNEAVRDASIDLKPCAYLHNYTKDGDADPLLDPIYAPWLDKAPAFCRGEAMKLREFIVRTVTAGDDGYVLDSLDSSRLRPSKSLQDALAGMLQGNDEFVMIDDQKVVFENAVDLARRAAGGEKHVLIVRGGPGTGKSVVAVNLLVRLTGMEMVCQYVSKNSAPRNVYSKLLQGRRGGRSYIKNLFRGSGEFYEVSANAFDALVVDEAHRLNEKSGLYGNLGDNQLKELIRAARFSVFFIDEAQRVTIKDVGTAKDIASFAEAAGAQVHEMELTSQFRCNGSSSYLDWLDDVLGIRTSDGTTASLDYDFRVFDDPHAMFREIAERNEERNRSRVVAGYCWEWPTAGRSDPNSRHIAIDRFAFYKSWNLGSTNTWAIDDGSIEQVGCVHTSQGLEFDYVGVIVGDDLCVRDGEVTTDYRKRARSDKSLSGIRQLAQSDPDKARRVADAVIRNTYRVLMTLWNATLRSGLEGLSFRSAFLRRAVAG